MIRAAATLAVAALALAACREPAPADDGVCSCTPSNVSRTRLADGTMFDGAVLLSQLRRHKRDVDQRRMPRDIKVLDDQLRFQILAMCQPCGGWVGDRLTMEAMFPLDRLDDAVDGVCMGLVLRDGTTVYGDARPRACR